MARAAKSNQEILDASGDKVKSTGLAVMQQDELALALGDRLDELGDTDGLEEMDAGDRKLAALVFNFKGVDENNRPIPPDTFFNTVEETVKPRVRLAMLTVHKSHSYTKFDSGENRNRTVCASWDRKIGTMDDGTKRPCEGCPDFEWRTDPNTKKRSRNCGEVHNVVTVDLDTGHPAVLRFRKTSTRAWTDFLNKHFFGKRIVNGKRKDLPLFCVETTVSLEMVSGKGASPYAVPVLERGSMLPADQIIFFAESARAFREEFLEDVRSVAENADARTGGDEGEADAQTKASDFADGPPPGVIDVPPAADDANQF